MVSMIRRPIGVWFSLALVILVLGAWVGSKLGSKIAQYWDSRQRQKQATLHGPEWAQVDSVLTQLYAVQVLQLFAGVSENDKKLGQKYLLNEIKGLEDLKHRPGAQEIRPVVDLYLGLAYVGAAMAEEQDGDKDRATKYMKSAQPLFQSLGWRDYSEEALRMAARRDLNKWKGQPQPRQDGK
jgi:hypothetical protein